MIEPEIEQPGIAALLGQLLEDAKGYARAEADYLRALAAAKLRALRGALIAGTVAFVLLVAAVIGLVVGALLTLAALVGPGLATLIVVLLLLTAAALLAWLASRGVRRAMGDEA